jgi:hypothetical protein
VTAGALPAALDAYRAAVRDTAHAEAYGRHGDGRPEAARAAEAAARRAVLTAARGGTR